MAKHTFLVAPVETPKGRDQLMAALKSYPVPKGVQFTYNQENVFVEVNETLSKYDANQLLTCIKNVRRSNCTE